MNPCNLRKGFTLIEIIVVIVLIGLVSAMAFSLLQFSNSMLSNGNKHYDIQNDIRLASTYLTKELRFATELEIQSLAQCEADMANLDEYNFFFIKNGIVNQAIFNSTSYSVKPISKLISSSSTESFFAKDISSNNVLNLKLTAKQADKEYSISTAVVLENFSLTKPGLSITGITGNGLAVKYKTREPHATLIPVSSITITGNTIISDNDGSIDLGVVVLPVDASIKSVLWSSSDLSVASINSAGVVRAQNNGPVNITAIASDGSGQSDTHTITVSGQLGTPSPIVTPTPTPTPVVTPIVTPTPTPIPGFIVSVVVGATNTSQSFDVSFGNTKVISISLMSKSNSLFILTPDIGQNEKNATLKIAGPVIDSDWIIVKFISNGGLEAILKFTYTTATKWVKS